MGFDGIQEGSRLGGRIDVVTGASSGIGRAIALALSRQGVQLCIVGRNPIALAQTVEAARPFSQVTHFQIDFTVEQNPRPLLQHLEREVGRLNFLIHSAGVIHLDPLERAHVENLDLQYATNVRAPYMLTQHLPLLLTAAREQIVFINSSAGLMADAWRRPSKHQRREHLLTTDFRLP